MKNVIALGQAIPEYLLIVAALATLLTLPLDFAGADGRCAAVYLADSVRGFYQSLTFFLSLP